LKKFPFFKQSDEMDCGPTCLKMVAQYYGKSYTRQHLRKFSGISKEGVSLLGISEAAEKIGFRTMGSMLSLGQLKAAELPMVLHWSQNHFVVLYKISRKSEKNSTYYIADPAKGLIKYNEEEFIKYWRTKIEKKQASGIGLLLSPTPLFFSQENQKTELNFKFLFTYLQPYKQLILQLLLGLLVGSLLQLILPFITQSIVDVGINGQDLNFIYIILLAQTALFIGRISVDFLRSWILLHISTRINISILTDFLIKLMKLPMQFFDVRMTGDIMQRMNDQKRIESFLTGPTLNIIFSLFNLVIFSCVLAYYKIDIFLIFFVSSCIYSLWVVAFLNKRRVLDFKRFEISAKNQNSIVQLVSGMQEIKLNNCEQQKRWEWEHIQAGLFEFSVKSLSLGQIQQAGSFFINEGKNIIITFLVAKAVIAGELTLGEMVAIQYIIGQVNSPIEQMLGFTQQLQDAKISLERLNEIHQIEDEEPTDKIFSAELPTHKSIELKDIAFTYPGAGNEPVLRGINLKIPEGKITAIVGMSGSGKTTLLKLLLRFYEPEHGQINIDKIDISTISFKHWRSNCGTVMQDGFIFSDSIEKNIAVADAVPNQAKLQHAIKVANIEEFISELPLGLNTKIGIEGNGISQGQKQRILIARAVYKNPEFILFDEATNALDTNNEKIIMQNMQKFFRNKTVILVAHRLSTVKNADQIVVLSKGQIIEKGTHEELIKSKGEYYKLVKDQLEMEK
jgi:ATP-binding cassette subfamily B protein